MAATRWKRIGVIVEIAVRDDSLSEREFKRCVRRALRDHVPFDVVMRQYRAYEAEKNRPVYVRNLSVKERRMVEAKEDRK